MSEIEFELPIEGATGFASVEMAMQKEPNETAEVVLTLQPGAGFCILNEEGHFWKVERNGVQGYVDAHYCFINLPDIIPSIVYNLTNASSSIFVSSGKTIPTITGEKLFDNWIYNPRLKKEEFIAPLLYTMAKKIQKVQTNALKNNETLVIYETFRPYAVQEKVCQELSTFAEKDSEVKAGISTPPWELEWFIADSISNHQVGYAFDVALAKVNEMTEKQVGNHTVNVVQECTEYQMYTPMHELSQRSAVFTEPVYTKDPVAWHDSVVRDVVNDEALRLKQYCTDAGMTPLASEWWHFNDLEAMNETLDNESDGHYFTTDMFSRLPEEC